ncbi:MAG: hypothetical protein VKK07_00780 [Merismopediaceae bacterium]|nr:hypothetical protein [Merismopediaceae bacterium]
MNLKPQIEALQEFSFPMKLPPGVFEKEIIPLFVRHAKRLKRSHFFVWESSASGQWIIFRLQSIANPAIEKTVLYAFSTEQDAKNHPDFDPSDSLVVQVPVLQLLFESVVFEGLDSFVFYPYPKNYKHNIELSRQELIRDIQRLLVNVVAAQNILYPIA